MSKYKYVVSYTSGEILEGGRQPFYGDNFRDEYTNKKQALKAYHETIRSLVNCFYEEPSPVDLEFHPEKIQTKTELKAEVESQIKFEIIVKE